MVKGFIEIEQERCKGCLLCMNFCPKKVIAVSGKANAAGYVPALFDKGGDCTGCAICATVCPEVAIEVYRE